MTVEYCNVNDLHHSSRNPRRISETNLRKLMRSILVFYKMLDLRPLVINEKNHVLGGNMRLRALKKIFAHTPQDIADILSETGDYQKLSEEAKIETLEHWQEWLTAPMVPVVRANTLSKEEQKQFIIKDNASYGEWNFDELKANWGNTSFSDWGVNFSFASPATSFVAPSKEGEPAEDGEQKLESVSLEPTKKKAVFRPHKGDEKVSDLKERIMIYKRKENYYLSIFRTTDEGYPLSEIKVEGNVEFFAQSVVKLVRGLIFASNKDLCILTTPSRRHKDWNFAIEVSKRVAKILNIPFYDEWAEVQSRDRLHPNMRKLKDIQETNIILFDDIITTGVTTDSCIELLPKKNVLCVIGIQNI